MDKSAANQWLLKMGEWAQNQIKDSSSRVP